MGLKHKILHEVRKTAIATIFFFFGFNLLALMLTALTPGYRRSASLFGVALFLSLMIGKVMVIADGILSRFIKRENGRFLPSVIQKAVAFTTVVLIAVTLEELVHGVLSDDLTFEQSFHHLIGKATLLRFLARASYLIALFTLYIFLHELDAYFAPRGLADVIFSRFHTPQTSDCVVMRLGLVHPVPRERAVDRLIVVQQLFALFQEQASLRGAQLELFDGSRAFVIWPDASSVKKDDLTAAFDTIQRFLDTEVASNADRALKLKGAAARGLLATAEIGRPGHRQIVRDGVVLDHANALFESQHEPGLRFDESLEQANT